MTVPRIGENPNCLPLAAMPSAARLAREYVAQRLKLYDQAHLAPTANIITSELVTNAVKAVGIVEERVDWAKAWGKLRTIAVCCYGDSGYAVIEVWDGDPQPPRLKRPTETDEGGRGLLLVEALAERWGYRWPKTGGKVVWCVLK
ncbi:ATP-binding protein [Actinoallomurus sp. NPDC052274]|uniref:ATP-binding protein n=1 Tax=Actinoallomurus sp. NPDC052274 TaxID=3155420 RepID=UPI003431ECE9